MYRRCIETGVIQTHTYELAPYGDRRVFELQLAKLYEKLGQSSNFRDVSLPSYLPSLVEEILGNFPNRSIVRVHKDIQDFILDARCLQPLGIIITELLTNVMKYVFRDMDSGLVSVSAALSDGTIRLEREQGTRFVVEFPACGTWMS